MTALYPADFYANRSEHTAYAAERVLSVLTAVLKVDTVADIGCGTGTWLSAALAKGANAAYGLEGDWVTPNMLDDRRIVLHVRDLEMPFCLLPRVDLAISLEVAEHLTVERADGFVADLTALAPAVLFSAAIPGQGGVGHKNERWQSWWAALFALRRYAAYDLIRPAIWADEAIPAWYRQNVILYLAADLANETNVTATDPAMLDLVHPAFWERANRELRYANALPESEVERQRGLRADGRSRGPESQRERGAAQKDR